MTFEITATRGTVEHYGPRKTDEKFGGRVSYNDMKKTAVWDFNYDDLPAGAAHNLNLSIPANSTIISAKFRVITAFTSTSTTTDLLVGLEQADGTDIDLDGLLTAANLTQTVIAVAGSLTTGTGALVGFTIGAAAGELSVTSSAADLLTGRAQVIVEYLIPDAAP